LLQAKGVIRNQSFDDSNWVMTNEVKSCSINFGFGRDELRFDRLCWQKLRISLKRYQLAVRVFITANFGAEIRSLQIIARGCKKLLLYISGDIALDELNQYTAFLSDFVDLLPSNTVYWEQLVDDIECMETSFDTAGQRKLGAYQSYFRFDKIISDFWLSASDDDKAFFFPVFFWWKLTAILPLRPTEFVLIPRNCLEQIDGKYYLTIRRTKLKGEKFAAEYSISKDYEMHQYQLPLELAVEIQNYIDKTEQYMDSDINTLLCQKFQYQRLELIKSNNSQHYTYNNLRSCLIHFYKTTVQEKLTVIEKASDFGGHTLKENEIERINLGDTRHIAMISLIASGGNPVICKELAGHTDFDISSNYYSNLKTFVDAMSFERHLAPSFSIAPRFVDLLPNAPQLADGGHCASQSVANGDFSDCMSTLSPEGHLMDCRYCKYYIAPLGGRIKVDIASALQKNAEKENCVMKKSFDNLLYYIDLARKGLGYESDVQSALLRLQASAKQYAMAKERIFKETD